MAMDDTKDLTITMRCAECGWRTLWHVEHRISLSGCKVEHCFVCNECGTAVPDSALKEYVKSGRVVYR